MRRILLAFIFTCISTLSMAACPGTITDCPSPTYNALKSKTHEITNGLTVDAGGITVTAGGVTADALTIAAKTITPNASGIFYPGHSLIGIQTFGNAASGFTNNSCGSGCTFTPDTGTNRVIFVVVGPGGGGGGCGATAAGNACVAGSGGSGSYAEVLYTTGFSAISITVPAPGAAGASGANAGGTGSAVTVGSLISCPGGIGGTAGANAAVASVYIPIVFGVAGPSACTITGGVTLVSIVGQGTGTGFAFSSTSNAQYAAAGGSTPIGLGAPAAIAQGTGSIGTAGTGFGCGPSGAVLTASQSATAGKIACPGIVIAYEFN